MNTVACIQARLGSVRLPGKILEPIGGVPALGHTVARAEAAGFLTWVLCPAGDQEAIRRAVDVPVWAWNGPEDDVLGRFADFARHLDGGRLFDNFIRLTGDNPWVDIETIQAVAGLVTSGSADFAGTVGWDEPWIDGHDVEAFTRELLLETEKQTTQPSHREHVTPAMKMLARRFAVCRGHSPSGTRRWTLDTAEDLEWFHAVAREIDVTPPHHPTYDELMALEVRCPELKR